MARPALQDRPTTRFPPSPRSQKMSMWKARTGSFALPHRPYLFESNELLEVGFADDTERTAGRYKLFSFAMFGTLGISCQLLHVYVTNNQYSGLLGHVVRHGAANRCRNVSSCSPWYLKRAREHNNLTRERANWVAVASDRRRSARRQVDGLQHSLEHILQIETAFLHRGENNVSRCFRVLKRIMVVKSIADPFANLDQPVTRMRAFSPSPARDTG